MKIGTAGHPRDDFPTATGMLDNSLFVLTTLDYRNEFKAGRTRRDHPLVNPCEPCSLRSVRMCLQAKRSPTRFDTSPNASTAETAGRAKSRPVGRRDRGGVASENHGEIRWLGHVDPLE